MKPLLLFLALVPLPLSALTPDRGVLHIILIGGQSNAVGQESAMELPSKMRNPQKNIPFFYQVEKRKDEESSDPVYTTLQPGASPVEDGMGPEVSFGRSLEEHYQKTAPGDRVAILKYARGGTNLYEQWKAGGDDTMAGDGYVYREFQRVIDLGLKALKADPELKGYTFKMDAMLWVQGESDLGHDHASDYAENLTLFIGDVRETFGKELEFYFSRISDNQTLYPDSKEAKLRENFDEIRKRQAEVSTNVNGTTMVDIDGPEFSMLAQKTYKPLFLHFDAKGQVAIGEAFASAFIANTQKRK